MTDDFDQKAKTWDEDPVRTARARDIARQILERVPLTSSMDVLEFGSGTGLLGFQLLAHVASVTFADPSRGMLDEVAAKLQAGQHHGGRTLQLDPESLKLERMYGAIVSLLALHHVADPTAAIRVLADHVVPGGWIALCDLDAEDGTFHDDPHAEVHHGFDRSTLVALVEGLGYTEVTVSSAYVLRKERPEGVREYPLFLLIAQRLPLT